MDNSKINEQQKKIKSLKNKNKKLLNLINDYEKTIEVYENLQNFSTMEIKDAYLTIQAYESIQELSRSEMLELRHEIDKQVSMELNNEKLKDAEKLLTAFEILEEYQRKQFVFFDKVMKAYEAVSEMSMREMKQIKKTIKAHEMVEDFAKKEIGTIKRNTSLDEVSNIDKLYHGMDKNEKTIKALENLMNHQKNTKNNLDSTVNAYRSFSDVSNYNLIDARRTIRIQEEIQKLSIEENQEINSDLKMAQKVQFGLISLDIPKIKNIHITSRYIPSMKLGGDFYGINDLGSGRTLILVSDAAGHGTQAALITMIVKTLFEIYSEDFTNPADFLAKLNLKLFDIIGKIKTFITAVCILIDTKKHVIEYANGGHPFPVFRRADKSIVELTKTGPLLGAFEDVKYYSKKLDFNTGDFILIYTDGAIECFDINDEEFGEERILRHIESFADQDCDNMLDRLYEILVKFHGSSKMDDDITFIALKAK